MVAPPSCRALMKRTRLFWYMPSRAARKLSPGTPNTVSAPWRANWSMRICPPVRAGALMSIASSYRSVIADLFSIHCIGPLFERRGKALERGVEHRSHQHRQHPALEFVGEVKPDVAAGFGSGLEVPAVFQLAERPFQIFHHDLQIGPVQRHPAGEGFPHQLERHRHIGDDDLGTVGLRR